MPSLVAAVLYVVAALWLLLMLSIALDRGRHERRARCLLALTRRLERCSPADTRQLDAIVEKLTLAQLDAVIRQGLPPALEVAAARAMQKHRKDLVHLAAGAATERDRICAVRILAAARAEQSYDLLNTMLRSGTPVLAAASIRILAKIDNRRSADLLIKALRAGVYSRSRIAAAIDTMTASRADLLGQLFTAPASEVRYWAAKLAGRLNAGEWIAQVRQLATDMEPLVRRGAVEALGVLGDRNDRALLLSRLNDPVPFVRVHAARACERFADGDTAEALIPLLADRQWIVRAAARETLQRIGPVAFPAVVQALWHSDTFAANGAAEILHRTGRVADAARQILADPTAARGQASIVAQFLTVGGPNLRAAFLSELTQGEQRVLTSLKPVMELS